MRGRAVFTAFGRFGVAERARGPGSAVGHHGGARRYGADHGHVDPDRGGAVDLMGHEIHPRFRADVAGNVGVVGNVGLMLDVDGGASADYSVAEGAYREAVAAEPLAPSVAEKEMIGKVVNLGPAAPGFLRRGADGTQSGTARV